MSRANYQGIFKFCVEQIRSLHAIQCKKKKNFYSDNDSIVLNFNIHSCISHAGSSQLGKLRYLFIRLSWCLLNKFSM